jgi:hypothetical protein
VSTVALLLNASFGPLKVISARRAVMLILSGKAEAVDDGDHRARYRSESISINVPSVVRLKYQVKIPYRATVPLCRALEGRPARMGQRGHRVRALQRQEGRQAAVRDRLAPEVQALRTEGVVLRRVQVRT